jgi:hypothetical protein
LTPLTTGQSFVLSSCEEPTAFGTASSTAARSSTSTTSPTVSGSTSPSATSTRSASVDSSNVSSSPKKIRRTASSTTSFDQMPQIHVPSEKLSDMLSPAVPPVTLAKCVIELLHTPSVALPAPTDPVMLARYASLQLLLDTLISLVPSRLAVEARDFQSDFTIEQLQDVVNCVHDNYYEHTAHSIPSVSFEATDLFDCFLKKRSTQ